MDRESFPRRHPGEFVTLCVVVFLASEVVGGGIARIGLEPPLAPLVAKLGAKVGACAAMLLLLALFRCWRMAGFTPPREWRRLHLALVPASLILIRVAWPEGPHESEPVHAFLNGSAMLLTGFAEEVAFRGLILASLASPVRPHPRRAVVESSLLFAAVHAASVLHRPMADALFQVAYAFSFGLSFAAVRLRTGTIWPAIAIHGLYDVVSSRWLAVSGASLVVLALLFALLGVWGWWQARVHWAESGSTRPSTDPADRLETVEKS